VFFFPPVVLGALPAPAYDRELSVKRLAGELIPGIGLADQLFRDEPAVGPVRPADDRAHGDNVGMTATREIRAELGVANQPLGSCRLGPRLNRQVQSRQKHDDEGDDRHSTKQARHGNGKIIMLSHVYILVFSSLVKRVCKDHRQFTDLNMRAL
jgi:hypothetical protein